MFGIAIAVHGDAREGLCNIAKLVGGERQGGGREVFLQAVKLGRAGDRHNPGLLREQPAERDLRKRHPLAGGDLVRRSISAWFAWRAWAVPSPA